MRQKGIAPILILIILVTLGAAGYFAYQIYLTPKSATPTQNLFPTPTIEPGLEPEPVPRVSPKAESNVLNMTGTLQSFMIANCQPGNPPTLDSTKLPVNIDFAKAGISIKRIFCVSTEDNTKPIANGYIVVQLQNNSTINIYDDQSQELGHGGMPFLGTVGQKIYEQGTFQINAWLQGGDGPQVLGSVGIYIRGIKKFITKDNHNIFVNYSMQAIPGNDARLVDQLKPYSSADPNLGSDQLTVNFTNAMETKIINYFFGAQPSASSPEGNSLEFVKTLMNAIISK